MPSPLLVIPALNEEAHLPKLLGQLLQDYPEALIVVCDGGSHDASIAIVQALAECHASIRLLHNTKRLQSAAVNLAVAKFGRDHDWLVRIDAHCQYPLKYVQILLEAAERRSATSVVVPMMTRGSGCFQRGVAAAQNSVLGTGGSPHRHVGEGRYVDHGHHALFDLRYFETAGGYDETFSHNEDAELDERLRAIGGRIWLEPSAALVYEPRASGGALLRQYYKYGQGRARTVAKHGLPLKPRQAMPLSIAPALLVAMIAVALSFIDRRILFGALPALVWAIACQAYALTIAVRSRSMCELFSGVAAMIMHAGWSFGYWSASASYRPLPRRGR